MKRTMAIGVVVAMATVATVATGCGGSSCEDAVGNAAKVFGYGGSSYGAMRAEAIKQCKDDHFSDALRSCMASAKSRDAFRDCEKHRKDDSVKAAKDYVAKSKQSEAELNLNMLRKSLKVHFVELATFPAGSVPLTPPTPCCDQPGFKCAPDPSAWSSDPTWTALDFELMEPSYFQYAYSSDDGKRATVTAVGDLDCDGNTITYTLEAEVRDGSPEFTLRKPTSLD